MRALVGCLVGLHEYDCILLASNSPTLSLVFALGYVNMRSVCKL